MTIYTLTLALQIVFLSRTISFTEVWQRYVDHRLSVAARFRLGVDKGPYLNDVYTERGGGGSQNADECR